MKTLILIILLLSVHLIFPQNNSLQISQDGIFAERYITNSPVLDFLTAFDDTLFQYDIEKHTVCKINFDFNFDGILDIALTDHYLWGAHIGPWEIYLRIENNKYLCVGGLWFHNDAIKIDSLSDGNSKILVFDRAGGANVDIAEYLLSNENIKEIKRNSLQFEDFEGMNAAFKEYKFQSLKDSCINVQDYINSKKIEWKDLY